MRILYWTDWFLPSIGGVEVFSARLLPALVARGHTITVVAGHHTTGLPTHMDWMGVDVHRFAFHSALAANDLATIADVLTAVAGLKRAFAPDLIHLNTLGPSVLFHLQSTHAAAAPTLLTIHSPIIDDHVANATLSGRALREAAWITCNSQAVHRDLCRRLPSVANRASVIYYGLETPRLPPTPRPREPRLLAYGRLVDDKGFDVALRAFSTIRAHAPSARLLLAGDGPARADLERLARDLGERPFVDFLGAVAPEDVPALINQSSLVLVPSRWEEPFGLVAVEAALMARPVVASRKGGLVEAVEDRITGLLVEADDATALAAAAIELLDDDALGDRLGQQGRERARVRFGWERCVDEYNRIYSRNWTRSARHE